MKTNRACFMTFIYLLFVLVTCLNAAGYEKKDILIRKTKNIMDCVGRSVDIPVKIERIACLYAFTGHAVTMMGRGDDIIAVSNGLKRDSLLHKICPSILNTYVPKAQGSINIEELLKAEPDVLFLSADVGKNSAETEKLDRFNIPYVVIDYSSIEEQQRAVTVIGETLNELNQADSYTRYFNECIKKVGTVTSGIPDEKRLRLYHSVNEANRTTINRNLSTDWFDVLGVINVASRTGSNIMEGKNYVSLEQIYIWNPDVILVNEPKVKRQILKDRQWATLTAVTKKKVFQMPLGVSRWGHPGSIETPLAILWAAKTFYPGSFPELDMAHETKIFYRNFFNHELPDQLVDQILSGKIERKPKKKR